MRDPDARAVAECAWEALQGLGVTTFEPRWFFRATSAAHKALHTGGAPPSAAALKAAIVWALHPERAQWKRGAALMCRWSLLLSEWQSETSGAPGARTAPLDARPVRRSRTSDGLDPRDEDAAAFMRRSITEDPGGALAAEYAAALGVDLPAPDQPAPEAEEVEAPW